MLNFDQIDRVIKMSLEEDMPFGDITTENIISEDSVSKARFIAKESGVIAGLPVAERTFCLIDKRVMFTILKPEGSLVEKGDVIATVEGPTVAILEGERTALNLLQRLSGVATRTHKLATLIEGTSAHVVDTRKTTPGLRYLEKYAVRVGGGQNHRFSLSDDMIFIKGKSITEGR